VWLVETVCAPLLHLGKENATLRTFGTSRRRWAVLGAPDYADPEKPDRPATKGFSNPSRHHLNVGIMDLMSTSA